MTLIGNQTETLLNNNTIKIYTPSFFRSCILNAKIIPYLFILIYFIFLMFVVIYAFLLLKLVKQDPLEDQVDGSIIVKLTFQMHRIINNKIIKDISNFLEEKRLPRIKKTFEYAGCIFIPHLHLDAYKASSPNNTAIFFYIALILIPFIVVFINPISFISIEILGQWAAECIYYGDFKSMFAVELYSIINDKLKFSFSSVIMAIFIVLGFMVLIFLLSNIIVNNLELYIGEIALFFDEIKTKSSKALLEDNNYKYILDKLENTLGKSIKIKQDNITYDLRDAVYSIYNIFNDRTKCMFAAGEDQIKDKLIEFSRKFKKNLLFYGSFSFVVLFLVFLLEDVFIIDPSAKTDGYNQYLFSFLELAETLKNILRHNFMNDYYKSQGSSRKTSIKKTIKYMWGVISKNRIIITITIVVIIGKYIMDTFMGEKLKEIFKSIDNPRRTYNELTKMFGGKQEIQKDAANLFVDIVKQIAKVLNDLIFKKCTKTNHNDCIHKNIFQILESVLMKILIPLSNTIQSRDFNFFIDMFKFSISTIFRNLNNIIDVFDFMNSKTTDETNNQSIINMNSEFLIHLIKIIFGKNISEDIIEDAKLLINAFEVTLKSFDERKSSKEISESVIQDFNDIINNKDNSLTDEDLKDVIKQIINNDPQNDDSLFELRKQNLYHQIRITNKDTIKTWNRDIKDKVEKILLSKEYIFSTNNNTYDLTKSIKNIIQHITILLYAKHDKERNVTHETNILDLISEFLNLKNICLCIVFNNRKIFSDNKSDEKINSINELTKVFKPQHKIIQTLQQETKCIYPAIFDILQIVCDNNNCEKIVNVISKRLGILFGLIICILVFEFLFTSGFATYNNVVKILEYTKVINEQTMFFDESNIKSVDYIFFQFKKGFNYTRITLAQGLEVCLDLSTNNFQFIYGYNNEYFSVDMKDNIFISVLGQSGAAKSKFTDLFAYFDIGLNTQLTEGDVFVYLTLKDGVKVSVPASAIDLKNLTRIINASKMQQDQKYNPQARISDIIKDYSGNNAFSNSKKIPRDLNSKEPSNNLPAIKHYFPELSHTIEIDKIAKANRKISEISGGQRQRCGIASVVSNILSNAVDLNLYNEVENLYTELFTDEVKNSELFTDKTKKTYIKMGIQRIIEHMKIYQHDLQNKYEDDLVDMLVAINTNKDFSIFKATLEEMMEELYDSRNKESSQDRVKSYILDESIGAVPPITQNLIMSTIYDTLGKKFSPMKSKNLNSYDKHKLSKYPTIQNTIMFFIEHGSISIKGADLMSVFYLDEFGNSFAKIGTLYQLLIDGDVPLQFKSDIIEAKLESILSHEDVSEIDKETILNIYKKIKSGHITDKDWRLIPKIKPLYDKRVYQIRKDILRVNLNKYIPLIPAFDSKKSKNRLMFLHNNNNQVNK